MYTRGRFDQDLYDSSDRFLRNADRERMLTIARNGRPDALTAIMLRLRAHLAARLIALGANLQPPVSQRIPIPLLPRRALLD